jgi:Delta 1-pyrroline-5-carboxylate dehydrogenase
MGRHPVNEPILNYAPGSVERGELQAELKRQMGEVVEIPCIIDGEEIFTGKTMTQVIPHNHGHVIANVHLAGRTEIAAACNSAVAAQAAWLDLGLEDRATIFERCADMLAGEWRARVNAATMLNQSKSAFQLKSTPPAN